MKIKNPIIRNCAIYDTITTPTAVEILSKLYICFTPTTCDAITSINMPHEIIIIKFGKKITKIFSISAVLEKPTKLKAIFLFLKFLFNFGFLINVTGLVKAFARIIMTFENTYQLKNIHVKRIGVKGISLGNVGEMYILNKYTLTRPANNITIPDP